MIEQDKERHLLIEKLIKIIKTEELFLEDKTLYYSKDPISLYQLAKTLKKTYSEIMSFFWNEGEKITKNDNISLETLSKFCKYHNLLLKKNNYDFNTAINEYFSKIEEDKKIEWKKKTPIVAVMGHIDHGKTTLVNTITKPKTKKKEIGEITQRINSSEVEIEKEKKIVFLDTPGHGDFIYLRKKGVSLVDLVILVISGKEGVMKQTEEIIDYLKEYSLPKIIFINHKKDEENKERNENKIKKQLQDREIIPLEWDGDTIVISGDAKDYSSSQVILENIFSFFNDFKANFNGPTSGIIIDSFFESKNNMKINKVLIKSGILKTLDYIFLDGSIAKIKKISNEKGKQTKESMPGEIANIFGAELSKIGEKLIVITKEEYNELSKIIELKKKESNSKTIFINCVPAEKENTLNFFIVTETENDFHNIIYVISKISQESNVQINIVVIGNSVGKLDFSDLEIIKTTESVVLIFNFFIEPSMKNRLKENEIEFHENGTIYQLIENYKSIINKKIKKEKSEIEEEILGEAKITVIYKFSKGNIAGCHVTKGILTRSNDIKLFREKEKIYSGKIKSMQIEKKPVNEAKAGKECGIVLEKFNDYKENDKIVCFKITKKANN